jgi:hypothetical protein
MWCGERGRRRRKVRVGKRKEEPFVGAPEKARAF